MRCFKVKIDYCCLNIITVWTAYAATRCSRSLFGKLVLIRFVPAWNGQTDRRECKIICHNRVIWTRDKHANVLPLDLQHRRCKRRAHPLFISSTTTTTTTTTTTASFSSARKRVAPFPKEIICGIEGPTWHVIIQTLPAPGSVQVVSFISFLS